KASGVVLTGKFLAVPNERHGAWIVSKGHGRVLLNLNDRGVEAPLAIELQGSRDGKGLVLGIRGSFRQNFGGFIEPALSLEAQCFPRERALVSGRHLKGTIKDRPCLVETMDALDCIAKR